MTEGTLRKLYNNDTCPPLCSWRCLSALLGFVMTRLWCVFTIQNDNFHRPLTPFHWHTTDTQTDIFSIVRNGLRPQYTRILWRLRKYYTNLGHWQPRTNYFRLVWICKSFCCSLFICHVHITWVNRNRDKTTLMGPNVFYYFIYVRLQWNTQNLI